MSTEATTGAPPPRAPSTPAADQTESSPADVTVVTTAAELVDAAGAPHIEIRGHLDLRSLTRDRNPEIQARPDTREDWLALLYARAPMESMRGNCTDPDAAAALGLSPEDFEAAPLLPLKPRQCLLLVPDSLLMANGGPFWLDNLYLKLFRPRFMPAVAVISAGVLDEQGDVGAIKPSQIALTNITFQGDLQWSATAVGVGEEGSTMLIQDCIFTDWRGGSSPLAAFGGALALVDTVFRNMRLPVEVADVSFGGAVRFRNVSLADVRLNEGEIVSTSTNDGTVELSLVVPYYAEDDADYDVEFEPLPAETRGLFDAEYVIVDEVMSDCLWLQVPPQAMLPGCPPESTAKRAEMIDRALNPDATLQIRQGPMALLQSAEGMYVSEWFLLLRATLGELPPPPSGWPGATIVPRDTRGDPGEPVERDGVLVVWPPPAGGLVPELEVTPQAIAAADRVVAGVPPGSGGSAGESAMAGGATVLVAVAAVVLAIAAAAVVWAAMALRRRPGAPRDGTGGLSQLLWHKSSWRKGNGSSTVTRATVSAPVVADSHGRQRLGSHISSGDRDLPSDRVPESVMNPDFEYALPTQLALLMGGPLLDTHVEDEETPHSGVSTGGANGGADGTLPASSGGEGRIVQPRILPAPACMSTMHGGLTADHSVTEGSGTSASRRLQGNSIFESLTTVSLGTMPSLAAASGETWGGHTASQSMHSSRGADGRTPVSSRTHTHDKTISPMASVAEGGSSTSNAATTHETGGAQRHGAAATQAVAAAAAAAAAAAEEAQQQLRRLQRQLDRFSEGDLFLGRFEMLGRHHRRRGGQGVVQFAEDQDRCEFAVKFFLDHASFLTEAALYAAAFPYIRSEVSPAVIALADVPTNKGSAGSVPMAQAVARFLPQVEAVCDGAAGGLEDPRGRPLPPCIVMEKGESLHDWSDRADPDVFTALAVLSNISLRLADMHGAGYVHRDLKPANVMWLPRQNRWTVIDFGCVARVGEMAPLNFTIAYAAPEVAVAVRQQQRSLEARRGLDAWSLGVMAYELLTGAPAFDMLSDGPDAVLRRLAGDLPLPWEGELSTQVKGQLGLLKGPVLQLLQREPGQRTSMRDFHATCTKLFSARAAVQA